MEYLSSDRLLQIHESALTMDFVRTYEHLHNNLPFSILYIIDNQDQLIGVFSLREYKQSLIKGLPVINREFLRVNNTGDAARDLSEFIKATGFDPEHPNVLNIPYVRDRKLTGEFSFHEKHSDISYLFEWELLDPDIISECKKMREDSGKSTLKMHQYHSCIMDQLRENGMLSLDNIESEYDLYLECLIRHILRRFRQMDIRFMYFEGPTLRRINKLPPAIRKYIDSPDTLASFLSGSDYPMTYQGYEKSQKYLETGEYQNVRFVYADHHYELADHQSETCNILNGRRITCDHSDTARNQLSVYGVCVARGVTVADCDTVESILQKMINQSHPNRYNVINYGVAEGVVGAAINDFQYILHTRFAQGDIVICLSEYDDQTYQLLRTNHVKIIHTSELYERETERWFVDIPLHLTPRANAKMAALIYEKLEGIWDSLKEPHDDRHLRRLMYNEDQDPKNRIINQDILDWTDTIKEELLKEGGGLSGRIGAIVANCNPFTCGHLHLMETASNLVDVLLIFVVEENKSCFPFNDRIDLVKKGVAHLKNAYVFPSGKYIISSVTFPEYFEKGELQDTYVNTALDVRIFGQYIAPALNISVRFVGQEPFDTVTREYNRTMREILGDYGIEFYEIPRATTDGIIISASYVRKLFSEGNWDQIEALVPPVTYQYLKHLEIHPASER